MMFWQKRAPDWRTTPEGQTADTGTGMSPKMYLAAHGAFRGLLGAFVGSIVFFLFFEIRSIWMTSSFVFEFQYLFIWCFLGCVLNLFTTIPAAAGGMLLAVWLYRDAKNGCQTTKKSILKGALVGCSVGLATMAVYLWISTLLPKFENEPFGSWEAVIIFFKMSPAILLAGSLGGAFAGWMLIKDIKNGYLYGYFSAE